MLTKAYKPHQQKKANAPQANNGRKGKQERTTNTNCRHQHQLPQQGPCGAQALHGLADRLSRPRARRQGVLNYGLRSEDVVFFVFFISKLFLLVIKLARISVHIWQLFIESECLLTGCVSYIKKIIVNSNKIKVNNI